MGGIRSDDVSGGRHHAFRKNHHEILVLVSVKPNLPDLLVRHRQSLVGEFSGDRGENASSHRSENRSESQREFTCIGSVLACRMGEILQNLWNMAMRASH